MELPPPPPHEQFAASMRQRTASCHFLVEPSEFLTVPQKKKFAVLVILHTVAPFILVPLWAYHERNWWLLLGIPAALFGLFLGSRASVQGSKATAGGFLRILLIALFFVEGWRSRDFFYTLCARWSWGWYLIADDTQRRWAEETLVTSRNAYERAVTGQKLVVLPKEA